MTVTEKKTLLALIKGLEQTRGQTQYYEGEQYISKDGIKVLETTIKNMPESN